MSGYQFGYFGTRGDEKHFRFKDPDPLKLRNEILEKMTGGGTQNEIGWLNIVLEDLWRLLPAELSFEKKIAVENLLRSIIGLWNAGKSEGKRWERQRSDKRLKEFGLDPRLDVLFPFAVRVYELHNSNFLRIAAKCEKKFPQYFKIDKSRIRFRRDTPSDFTARNKKVIDYANGESLSYNQALELASKNVIPQEEFHEREIELQNSFKQWRLRQARRDHKK